MNRPGFVVAPALLSLAVLGCHKPDAQPNAIDAEAASAWPTAAASASAVPSAVTAAPSSSVPSKYAFSRQTDFLSRWSMDVPTTFTKATLSNPCTDSGCLDYKTKFEGDGLEVSIEDVGKDSPSDEQTAAKLAGGGKVTAEKALPRGWWITAPSVTKHVFVQQIESFSGNVRLTVAGPIARRAEIEGLVAHLSASLNVPANQPAKACKALPWDNDGGPDPSADFTGKLVVGEGFNASMVNEKPYVLELDAPVCDSTGAACWEAQAYTIDKGLPELKSLVGKHLLITGTFHGQQTAHHHRPIMLEAKKIGVQ